MDMLYDLVIIGGGPAGASAAVYAARAKRKVLVLDRPGRDGMLELAEAVANFPGVQGPIPGAQLIKLIRDQATAFGARFVDGIVVAAQLAGEVKSVYTEDGDEYQARVVIIASGALERKTKIPGEETYWGRGVSGCTTCDAPFYEGKTAIVVGNDDYAATETLELAKYAVRVYLMTPSMTPTITDDLLAALRAQPAVKVCLGWFVKEILGDGETVHGARFQTREGEEIVKADGVFLYLGGSKPSTGFLLGQVPVDADGAILVHTDQSTDLPRVYAVGDVTAGHVRQAVVAAGEGCIAALAAERDLAGKEAITPDYH